MISKAVASYGSEGDGGVQIDFGHPDDPNDNASLLVKITPMSAGGRRTDVLLSVWATFGTTDFNTLVLSIIHEGQHIWLT
jgi:hypothetical protein